MDEPYQSYLTSMSTVGLRQISDFQDVHPQALQGIPESGEWSPAGDPQAPTSRYFQASSVDATKSHQSRKKPAPSNPAGDAVKHRRTRSGCFTCRSRRVKCDEARPVCERCKKGNRDCVYPDPPAKKGSSSRASRQKDAVHQDERPSPLSSPDEQDDYIGGPKSRRDGVKHESRLERAFSAHPSATSITPPSGQEFASSHEPETPSQEDSRSSPSSSTVTSSGPSTVHYDPSDFPQASDGKPEWSHLPLDYQGHLRWYDNNITHYHYGLRYDLDGFFSVIVPRMAMQSEALLNAVVAFSAYHTTLQNPNGRIQDFLVYYNRSVRLLLESLRRKEKYSVSILMTILQIAQIEEYLGDWVNVLGHQKAALEIFTKMFSPSNVVETPVGRMCLSWYSRFDGFVAFMGSFPSGLSTDYFDVMLAFFKAKGLEHPDDVRWELAQRTTHFRQISRRQALLYARKNRGQISAPEFVEAHQRLTEDLKDHKRAWDPSTTDPRYLVTDFEGRQPGPDNIFNPYEPGILYDFPLFDTTLATAEWHSTMIMHMIQALPSQLKEMLPELTEHANTVCRCFETIKFWPHSPPGVITQAQAVFQTATIFLPRDERHFMWIRKNLAYCESKGFIRAQSTREKLAKLFNDDSCVRWWLPNDEGFTPILKSIRDFADERNAVAVTAQQESVREVRQLYDQFGKMELS